MTALRRAWLGGLVVLAGAGMLSASCAVVVGDFTFVDAGAGGSRTCAANAKACTVSSDCPASGTTCATPTCSLGCCTVTDARKGASCSDHGGTACDGEGTCSAAHCSDGTKDGDETGVDCGGSCAPCADGQGCAIAKDCVDGVCSGSPLTCQAASCTDGVQNGQETDVDCGGGTCPACVTGQKCDAPTDCAGGANGTPTCAGNVCGIQCMTGYAGCGSVKGGCDTPLDTTANCGACGVTCSAYCVNGSCNDPTTLAFPGGYEHTCAILKNGDLYCWGYNAEGEVGDGTTTTRLVPTKVKLPGPATAVAANGFGVFNTYVALTCALLSDKTVQCWGANTHGQLGIGSTTEVIGPQAVNLPNVTQISVGAFHACALDTAQDLYCWGAGSTGALGTGTTTDQLSPVKVLGSVVKFAATITNTCAITTDGNLHCWGDNSYSQIGNDSTTQANSPVTVYDIANVLEVAGGYAYACARNGVGLYCWGDNSNGQLGLGTTTTEESPQPLSLAGVTQLGAGLAHMAAITSSGLFTWGANSNGQLGNGTAVQTSPSPAMIAYPNAASVTATLASTCAINTAHVMSCWGSNGDGTLGNGTTADSSTPVPVTWP